MTAEDERAAVVAWLREQAVDCDEWPVLLLSAAYIERGDHITGGE